MGGAVNERNRSEGCLDRRTLETIAAGRCPIDQVEKLRTHLPRCSKCRAAIVACTGRRPRGGDTVLLSPGQYNQPEQPQLALRMGLVVAALLSVGIAIWFTTAGANVREVVERSLRPESSRTPASAAPRSIPPSSPGAAAPLVPVLPSAPLIPSGTPARVELR
jgi:hypothetical protein